MINNNRKLTTLIANPVRLSLFSADNCHHIQSDLGETFHQRLLDLVIHGNVNAFSTLLNMRADAVHWAMITRSQSVFNNLNLQWLDARNVDLEYADFEGCDFSNANFSRANLNNMNARRAIFTGAIFGQLPKMTSNTTEKIIVTESRHGILAATIAENGLSINIANNRTGTIITTFKAHDIKVNSLKFTADGKFLVSSGCDYTIKFWNVSNWQCHKTLKCHSRNVKCITTSPDNQLICSIDNADNEHNTITMWRIKTGEPLHTLDINFSISAIEIEPTIPQGNMPTWIVKVFCDNNDINRFIFVDDGSELQLITTEKSNQLSAKGMDITESIGLTEDNLKLLQQLGALCDNALAPNFL